MTECMKMCSPDISFRRNHAAAGSGSGTEGAVIVLVDPSTDHIPRAGSS